MTSKAHMTGMRGVYLVAAELSRAGLIASPTSRSAAGADILATDHDCKKSFSVQVKTDTTKSNFWLLGKRAKDAVSDTHIYVFVKIKEQESGEEIEYFIVPSHFVSKNMDAPDGDFPNIKRKKIEKFLGKWDVFSS